MISTRGYEGVLNEFLSCATNVEQRLLELEERVQRLENQLRPTETFSEDFKFLKPLTSATDSHPVVRENIEIYEKEKAFILHNVLSPRECEYYIKQAEELRLEPLGGSFRKDYRNNDRVVVQSEELSKLIWERVKCFIKPIEITKNDNKDVGLGYNLEGTWFPLGLNSVWRMCRYKPGGHFGPHFDGNFIQSSHVRSMKTFMLYLNGNFEGGTTNFLQDQKLFKENGIFKAEEKNIIFKIHPDPGMALVFNHSLLHEGGQLMSGQKYIMRSEIMFERSGNLESMNPKEKEAILLFQEAERLESDGQCMEAAECYRKAFKMWPPLADAYNS